MIWTALINLVLSWVKKLLPYIIIGGLLLALFFAFKTITNLREDLRENKENVNQLLEESSQKTQLLELTRQQVRDSKKLQSMVDSLSNKLRVKPKHITSIHTIKGETVFDTLTKIDTLYIEEKAILSAKFESKCLTAKVTFKDSAKWEIKQLYDLNIVGYKERPKNWFINFKWNKNKWPNRLEILTPCDSIIYKENIKFELK